MKSINIRPFKTVPKCAGTRVQNKLREKKEASCINQKKSSDI